VILGLRRVPFSRLRIWVRFSPHAEHSQAVEGISTSEGRRATVREQITKETYDLLEAKDICENVTGTRTIKRTVIIKKRAMWPVSS